MKYGWWKDADVWSLIVGVLLLTSMGVMLLGEWFLW